jgi:transcriptional regulator with XRE-family HTH domain
MSIAEQLLTARDKAGLSQAGLAKLAGVSAVAVCHIEGGRGTGVGTLTKLAAALGTTFTIGEAK